MQTSDLSMQGSITMKSGEYNNIVICGLGTGSGEVRANKLEVNGTYVFDGTIYCNQININGLLKTDEIKTDKIRVNGKLHCLNLFANEVSIHANNDCCINFIRCKRLVTSVKKSLFFKHKNKANIRIYTIESEYIQASGLYSKEVRSDILKAYDDTYIVKLYCAEHYIDDSVLIDEIIDK